MNTTEQLLRTFPSDYPDSRIAYDQMIEDDYWAWCAREDLVAEAAQRSADARREVYFSPQLEGLV